MNMKLLIFILALVYSEQTLNFKCPSFKDKQDCLLFDNCHFHQTSSLCYSKCIDIQDATLCNANIKCYNPQICLPKFNKCNQKDGKDMFQCILQHSSCKFVPAQGTCSIKDSVQKECNKKKTKHDCNKDTKCIFQNEYSCQFKSDQCKNAKQSTNCMKPFCNLSSLSCNSLDQCSPSTKNECLKQRGCKWDEINQCQVDSSICQIGNCPIETCKEQFECTDNIDDGTQQCKNQTNAEDCNKQNGYCESNSSAGQCQVKNKCPDFLNCDQKVCDKVQTQSSQCNNHTCPLEIQECAYDQSCNLSQSECLPKPDNLCISTNDEYECNKYENCNFRSIGQCANISDFSQILTLSSLLSLFIYYLL